MEKLNADASRLEEVLKIAKQYGVQSIKIGDIKASFGPTVTLKTDDEIKSEVNKFRRVAEDEQRDFEKTLFYSADPA